MKAEYGDKINCISIGPAGEMKMCAASIAVTTWNSDRRATPAAEESVQ